MVSRLEAEIFSFFTLNDNSDHSFNYIHLTNITIMLLRLFQPIQDQQLLGNLPNITIV